MAKMGGIRKANGKPQIIFRLHLVSIPSLSKSCQFQSLHLAGPSEALANHPIRRPRHHRANLPNPCTTGPDFHWEWTPQGTGKPGPHSTCPAWPGQPPPPCIHQNGVTSEAVRALLPASVLCVQMFSGQQKARGSKGPALLSGLQSVQTTVSSC